MSRFGPAGPGSQPAEAVARPERGEDARAARAAPLRSMKARAFGSALRIFFCARFPAAPKPLCRVRARLRFLPLTSFAGSCLTAS